MARTTLRTVQTSPAAERGTGLIGTSAAVIALLVMVMFATQLLLNLYATSVVSAATFDAARAVAVAQGDPEAVAPAEDQARRVIGRLGERARFEWRITSSEVEIHVHADNHNFFFEGLRLDAIQEVDRTVRVRIECFRGSTGECR